MAIRCISSFFGKFNIFSRKNTRKKKKNLNHEGHYYDRNSLQINLIIIGKQKHQQRDHFSEMVELIGSWKTLFCYVLSTVILITVMHQIVLLARDWSQLKLGNIRGYKPSDIPKFSNLASWKVTRKDERAFSYCYRRRDNFVRSFSRTRDTKEELSSHTWQTVSCSQTFYPRVAKIFEG